MIENSAVNCGINCGNQMQSVKTKLKKLFRLLAQVHFVPAWIICRLIPVKRDRIVFGSMNGLWYADNSCHLFKWYLSHRPEIDAIWLTGNQNVYQMLRAKNLPVARIKSWQGAYFLQTASIGYFTHSFRDLAAFQWLMPKSLRLVALRHGRSVKRIRFARKQHKLSAAEKNERQREGKLIRYAISTSRFISDIQEECLRIGPEKHVVTGYPRNDCLFDISENQRRLWREYLGELRPDRVILYGPSWRHGREPTRFFPFNDFESHRMIEVLHDNCILLLLRPHKNDLKNPAVKQFLDSITTDQKVVKLCTHSQFPDVNSFLPFVDALISDYSALYHDFLMLDRPMLFIPYDFDTFNKENGFLYDYFDNLPGPAINSFDEFVNHIVAVANGKDEYSIQRAALLARLHQFRDAGSCERVAALLE